MFRNKGKGYETTIHLDEDDTAIKGQGFNVFAVKERRLVTTDLGILEGASRLTVLKMAAELSLEFDISPRPLT